MFDDSTALAEAGSRPSSSEVPGSPLFAQLSAPPDYDQEARKLFKLLNLSASGASTEDSRVVHRYNDLDAVWEHPATGARVFIGNRAACCSRSKLRAHGITYIVNCTSDMPNVFEGKDSSYSYFRFDIYELYRRRDIRSENQGVLMFFRKVFDWIDAAVAHGHSVLIHCLAGAHRAGTTGVAYVMHASDLDDLTATAACKTCRPIVDPIHDLSAILAQLSVARGKPPSRNYQAPMPAVPVIGCACGYTCGTEKALELHLSKFVGEAGHGKTIQTLMPCLETTKRSSVAFPEVGCICGFKCGSVRQFKAHLLEHEGEPGHKASTT